MTATELKASILDRAVRGLLVPQDPREGTAADLFGRVEVEKCRNGRARTPTAPDSSPSGRARSPSEPLPIAEDEMPFSIPEGWEWVRLNEVGQIVGGGTPKTNDNAAWENGTIPWLTPADMREFVQGKYISHGARNISQYGLDNSSARLMPKDSIVYSSRAPIGYIAITKNDLCTNQGFKSIVPDDIRMNGFLYYAIMSRKEDIVKRASGTTFKEISGKDFGLTLIPLPPLAEQKRIVAKIEELMPLVEEYGKAESELAALNDTFPDALRKSILQHAVEGKLTAEWRRARFERNGKTGGEGLSFAASFETTKDLLAKIAAEKKHLLATGKIKKQKPLPPITDDEKPFPIPDGWEWVRLGEICSKIGAGATPKGGSNVYVPCGVKLLREQNVYDDGLHLDNVVYITEETNDGKPGSQVQPRDILVNITGASIGRNALVPDDFDIANVNQHVLIVRLIDQLLRFYIHECLRSPLMLNLMYDKQSGDKPGLSAEKVMAFPIPLPPLAEQKEIVSRVEELLSLVGEMKRP